MSTHSGQRVDSLRLDTNLTYLKWDTFPPVIMPFPIIPLTLAYGTQLSYECDVRSLEQQKDSALIQSRVVPGLNSVKVSIGVNQIVTNGKTLEVFLNERKGRYPFAFGVGAPPEITGKLFKCKEFSINYQGQQNAIEQHQLQATFTEVVRAIE